MSVLDTRKRYSATAMAAVVILFIVVNLAAIPLLRGARVDLTDNKLHTLSPGTINILKSLEGDVELSLYWTGAAGDELPGLRSYAQQVQELLEEYSTLAGGRLAVSVADPQPFSEEEDEAVKQGLVAASAGKGDPIYLGLVGKGANGVTKVIPFLQPDREQFLEHDVSQLVYDLSHPEKPIVGLITSLPMNGGLSPMNRFQPSPPWTVLSQIREQFQLKIIPPDKPEIPDDVNVLMVVHPRPLKEDAFYAIDQFVLRGGRTLLFIDPFSEAENAGHPSAMPSAESGVDLLLGAWGAVMPPDKVVEDRNIAQQVTWQGRYGSRVLSYLPWLAPRRDLLSRDQIITSQLGQLNLASAGALSLAEGSSLQMTTLVKTTRNSMLIDADRMAMPDPPQLIADFKSSGEEKVLAALLTGDVKTAFPDGPPAGVTLKEGSEHLTASASPINVLVVTDADMLMDRFWVNVQNFFGRRIPMPMADNGSFVLNALDQMGGSPDLISIRGRASAHRPFELLAEISAEAESRYRNKERELMASLDETETKLNELQAKRQDSESPALTPEQEKELEKFRSDKVRIRKDLRKVQFNLRRDIERLESALKFLNIGLVPILVALGGVLFAIINRRRRRAAASES